MCSELTPRAHVPDNRIPQLMQPWSPARIRCANMWFIIKWKSHYCVAFFHLCYSWYGNTCLTSQIYESRLVWLLAIISYFSQTEACCKAFSSCEQSCGWSKCKGWLLLKREAGPGSWQLEKQGKGQQGTCPTSDIGFFLLFRPKNDSPLRKSVNYSSQKTTKKEKVKSTRTVPTLQ